MDAISKQVEEFVLSIHRRNGGKLNALDFDLKLLDPALGLDSLDLAEVMVAVEKRFQHSPFNSPHPPRTWRDLIDQLTATRA